MRRSCSRKPSGSVQGFEEVRVINRRRIFGIYRGLPTSVYVVFFARIVNSMGNLVYPFLTLYLTTKMGYSTATAGLFMSLASFTWLPGSMLGGKLADHFGRKVLLVAGLALSALFLMPLAFLSTSVLVPLLLVISRFFGALADPAYSALVADLTTAENRKSTFSLLYLGNNIGYAAGPMIAGFLFRNYLPLLFLGDAATTLLSVMLLLFLVPETHPGRAGAPAREEQLPEAERAATGSLLSILLQRPILLVTASLILVYNLVYSQQAFTLPVQMNQLFGEATGPVFYGTLMTVNAVIVVAITSLITAATMRMRPLYSMGLGGVAYAIGFGMLFFIRSQPLFVVSTIIWTVGEVLNSVNTGVFIADNSPSSHRGRVSATLTMIGRAGWTFGPLLAGLWLKAFPVGTLWALCFFLALAAAALMFLAGGAGRNVTDDRTN